MKSSKEWFDDSSSGEEVDDYSNCHPHKRLRGNGWGRNGKEVCPMVEVVVKITLAKVGGPSRSTLRARIRPPFGHGGVPISLGKSSGGHTKKNGKSEVRKLA